MQAYHVKGVDKLLAAGVCRVVAVKELIIVHDRAACGRAAQISISVGHTVNSFIYAR